MVEKRTTTNEQRRQLVVEKMWLNFYNDQLLSQGVITPQQHKKMCAKISSRRKNLHS